jgi:acetyl esterase/lipase
MMSSLPVKITKKVLRLQNYGWAKGSIAEQRTRQARAARFLKLPRGMQLEHLMINDIPAVIIEPQNSEEGIILYLHGGAYALGSIDTHLEFLSRLALATRLRVTAIDYRLAPEDPFPAALEDSVAAYRWLIQNGFSPTRIVIAGDSAGGGLVVSSLVSLRDLGVSLPACGICLSPWLDLTLSGASMRAKAAHDPLLSPGLLSVYAGYYAGSAKKDHPLISPLFADVKGLPPLLFHSGTDEILLDDSVRFCKKARRARVDVSLQTWEGLFHVFQMVPFICESGQSLKQVAEYIHGKITENLWGNS